MPERPGGDNNTIGLMCLFRLLELRELFPKMRLTPRRAAHISAAPTANGADGDAPAETGRRAEKLAPEAPSRVGLDQRVVCSMHRLLGKGYAGGGERQFRPSGWLRMFSSSLVRGSALLDSFEGGRAK